MGYQVGILVSEYVEESFGDYHWETRFVSLRPVRETLSRAAGDLTVARKWLKKRILEDRKWRERYGPSYRSDSWNWRSDWHQDPDYRLPAIPDREYEISIRLVSDTHATRKKVA